MMRIFPEPSHPYNKHTSPDGNGVTKFLTPPFPLVG
jgi:hypothetical protein